MIDKKEIIYKYKNGCTIVKIAKEYNTNRDNIYKIIKSNKCYKSRMNKYNSLIDQIKEMYISGMSCGEISKIVDIDRQYIHKLLVNNGVSTRKENIIKKIYNIDDNIFNKIDTEETSYWLGFLYADGCISKKYLILSLAINDISHIKKFIKFSNANYPIQIVKKHGNQQDQTRISFYSKKITDDLIKYGCTQRKTFTISFPNFLNSFNIRHFIRGYFDGDGHFGFSLSKTKLPIGRICIVGTIDFCNSLRNIISENLNINGSIRARHKERNNNIRMYEFAGNKQVIRFLDYLYQESTVYLDRKYNKYKHFMELYKSHHESKLSK